MQLLSAAGNGDGSEVVLASDDQANINEYTAYLGGTLDGATVSLQLRRESGGAWHTVQDYEQTVLGAKILKFKAYSVRGSVAGGGGSVAVDLDIV